MKYTSLPTIMSQSRSELEEISRKCAEVQEDDYGFGCRVLGKYICYVNPQDLSVAQNIMRDGFWEAWITLAWLRELELGQKVVDIGANCGYFTLTAADAVGAGGSVIAFEPQPGLAEALRASVDANGFRNVSVRTEALWDGPGSGDLYVIDDLNGSSSLWDAEGYDTHPIPVDTIALDSLDLEVDVVKIDAEGAEEAIWRGMQGTLDANPDVTVIMEVDARRYEDADAFFGSIAERFPLRMIDFGGEIVPYESSQDIDMLYLKKA